MFAPPKAQKPPKLRRSSNKNWLKGVVTEFDSSRSPIDGLVSSANTKLYQDGTVGPRPSLKLYGPQPAETVLGEIFEFKSMSGLTATQKMICMQSDGTNGNIYVASGDDSSWTKVTGKNYSKTAKAHFVQAQNKILIMNGVDSLSYYDIELGTLVAYTALTKAGTPTLTTNTGLSGTDFKVYYAVTANSSVGETEKPTTVLTVDVSTDRDVWNKDTQSIKIGWTAVANAKSYNVYCGVGVDGAGAPTLYAIATGLDPAALAFTDNGTRAQDLSRPLPSFNSTAGPKASRGAVINGRPWLVGDADNPYYVWRGGDFEHEMDFSPSNGGGYTPIGYGTKEIPIAIKAFRDGKGDQRITVLTQSTNGAGRRYLLSPREITHGNTTFVVWESSEDSGADGTDSPDALIVYNNSLFYPSRDGFKTTGTKPQLQNVLSTDRISNTIQKDIALLNTDSMALAVGLAYEGCLYFALPVNSTTNSEIWVIDLDREGAWMKPWSVAADWMWLYNDNNGKTHFCVLKGNGVYEFTNQFFTNDNGVAFLTSGESGQIGFSDDELEWASISRVVCRLLRPQGVINLSVTVGTEDGPLTFTHTEDFTAESTVVGWGEIVPGMAGFGLLGFSQVVNAPEDTGEASTDVEIEIDEEANWWKYAWSTPQSNAKYQIGNVTAEYVAIGTKDLD